MMDFDFSYDKEEDDLFVYLKNKKSAGAIEFGNFILDFDLNGNLVSMQILNASEILSKIFSRILELNKIKRMQVEIINFRNIKAIKFRICTENKEETANIFIPHIKEKSPVLQY